MNEYAFVNHRVRVETPHKWSNEIAEWLDDHAKNRWSLWWCNHMSTIINFELEEDALLFRLRYGSISNNGK